MPDYEISQPLERDYSGLWWECYSSDEKEGKKEYQRQWENRNKEHRKEYRKKYYQENKDIILENHRKWRERNKENIKDYYENNREKILEQCKKHSKTEKGRANHQRANSKRRARMKNIVNTLTVKEWLDILKEYKFKCAYCGKEFTLFNRETHDHVIPLSKGGNNTKENVVPACQSCNTRKHNKLDYNI